MGIVFFVSVQFFHCLHIAWNILHLDQQAHCITLHYRSDTIAHMERNRNRPTNTNSFHARISVNAQMHINRNQIGNDHYSARRQGISQVQAIQLQSAQTQAAASNLQSQARTTALQCKIRMCFLIVLSAGDSHQHSIKNSPCFLQH